MYRSRLSRYTLPALCLCAALACAAAVFPRAASGQSGTLQFSAAAYNVTEGTDVARITVTRSNGSNSTSVDYQTLDGTASDRSDYTTARGELFFPTGVTSLTFDVPITNDAFGEAPETFQVQLSNLRGGTMGTPDTAVVTVVSDELVNGPNPVKDPAFDTDFFVRQHYHDFLSREPDTGGLAFWKAKIDECATQQCREVRRINVSAAFFLSIEFQETGFYAIRVQRVAYGRRSNDAASRMSYRELVRDQRLIGEGIVVGQPDWEQSLANSKHFYTSQVQNGPAFNDRFPQTNPATYADALYASAGVVPTPEERQAAISAFSLANSVETGRAAALRVVADSNSVRAAEFNDAFVLLQYHGYLRRNPTDPPDADDTGYQFWRAKLNQFNGNYVQAEMVNAFLSSDEYKSRFGQ